MKLAFDTGALGIICHDRHKEHQTIVGWLTPLMADPGVDLYLPAIADYELRRKLLHLGLKYDDSSPRVERLDRLREVMTYLSMTDSMLKRAAQLWAEARNDGQPTAPDKALDGDVLIAAQALSVGATVITDNRKHLERYCLVADWRHLAAQS